MKKKLFCTILALGITMVFSVNGICQMSSANYSIPTSVLSGGGIPMTSANYDVKSSLAQPTPLSLPSDPAESLYYALYPGFWYTVDGGKVKIKYMPWVLLLLDD